MLKNYRVLVWLLFIVVSVVLIAPNPSPKGYRVTFVEKDSPLKDLRPGDVLHKINFSAVTPEALAADYYGAVEVVTHKGSRFYTVNGTLGVAAEKVDYTSIKFGLDLKGGVHAVLKPETNDTIDQVISVLQTRISVYGLREAVFRPVWYEGQGYIDVSIAGGSPQELKELISRQGKFEAKIPVFARVVSNQSALALDKEYVIGVDNDALVVEGRQVARGGEFVLAGVPFTYGGVDKGTLNLTALVYTGSDIRAVYFDPQRSRVEPTGSGFAWSFTVQLSPEGAQKFAWVTKNVQRRVEYLESQIHFYLDGNLIDALNIASNLQGNAVTEISIQGLADSRTSALNERLRLQSILRSGALPTKIDIEQLDTISASFGSNFIWGAVAAGTAAIAGVSGLIFLRYRKWKIALPVLLFSFSEVVILLGMSVLIGQTIDLAAIAGIIATVGTGVDSQIIIVDQALRKEQAVTTLKERLKRAFFIIFGAAGTIIAAMVPLMIFGFGLLKGFALITILGVLSGILIARPAFGAVIERLVKE